MSLSFEVVRNTLVQEIVNVKDDLGIPLFWENRESAQLDAVQGAFLTVDIDFNAGVRAGLDRTAFNAGVLVLTHFTRVGTGTVEELKVGDTLAKALAMRVLGDMTLSLGAMQPGDKGVKQGWRTKEWLIPFSFYA